MQSSMNSLSPISVRRYITRTKEQCDDDRPDLLQRHFQTLVADNVQWQTLIADDILWELVYAPAIGHPARLSGREEVERHVSWFLGSRRSIMPRTVFFGCPQQCRSAPHNQGGAIVGVRSPTLAGPLAWRLAGRGAHVYLPAAASITTVLIAFRPN